MKKIELLPNGSNIKLSKDNLDEYINLRIQYIYNKFKDFAKLIQEGLFSVIPENLMKLFNSEELELIINGTPFIDIIDWKENTSYMNCSENDPVVAWFWQTLESFSQEMLAKLLQFATGSTRVPIGGFKELESNRGNKSRFTIILKEMYYRKPNYIRSHTCFNRLDIPKFLTKKQLEEAIDFSISNGLIGFGIE